MANAFVDTNILLYCFDRGAGEKRDAAMALVAGIAEELVISTQVMQEFYWNATKKLKLTPPEAKKILAHFPHWRVVMPSPAMVLDAIETSQTYRISFWDSMIVESAAFSNCTILYTEDLNHGQSMRGVKVRNPFA